MNAAEKQILKNQLAILNHFVNKSIGFWGIFEERANETKELLKNKTQNKPLTLEELMGMDGPVWCKVSDTPWIPRGGYWCLCMKGKILTPSMSLFDVSTLDLGDWVFYRRRPEEETT